MFGDVIERFGFTDFPKIQKNGLSAVILYLLSLVMQEHVFMVQPPQSTLIVTLHP